ncbi:hypothetical protein PybrP1_007199 [[Pythium] brassicae (nom. inval.)]|nr:hypothetical protein PybrP1_007199 [[Pythium] brassicae (nom. inval.)]
MKFVLALVAAAVVSVAAYNEVTECPSDEFLKLAPLVLNANLTVCQDAAQWQMIPPVGYPTPKQRAAMCATPECFALIGAIKALGPSDCVLVFGDVRMNVKKLAEEFEPSCF